jgi:N12 class adenine-specific DNA methylase
MPQAFKEDYAVPYDWKGIRADLDGLLTPEEFASARASTPNAHYTSPMVIKAMWDAADRLGLLPKDGLITVLEPSMGAGSFFGLMPEGTEASRTGVELDSITGRIAKALYPQSDVHVAGFEKVRLPNDYFDLAISNVPFGNYPVFDTQYKRTPGVTRSIHDYFFAKALDKVRPGGVVAFITSSYTMDKQDPFMRDYLAKRADLVGAIRLPNTAFKASAGTEVTTDIIFLQKRAQDAAPSREAWTQLKPITGERKRPDGSMGPVEMQVNEYYAAHPEMMLGKMGTLGSMYRDETPALTGNLTPENLAEAIARLPENIVQAWKAPEQAFESVSSIPAPGELKDGGYTVKDGKVLVRVGDQLRPTDLSGPQLRSVSGQTKVRDAVYEVFRTQLQGAPDTEIAQAMKKLNTAYDAFVRNNGPLHKKENAKAFADDPDAPVLLALEDWDKETQKATKADIFSKRVIDTTKPATSADNAKDALSLSLNEKGRIDWVRMQELTGRTPKDLQEELGPLVYQNPSGKAWEPADEYLSGNVRRKLADAEAAAQMDRKFARNVDALKAVQPKELLPGEIKARLGSSWIPKQDIQKFVSELLDIPMRSVSVGHSEGLGSWTLSLSQRDTVANNRTWGTNRFFGHELIDDALNLRSPTVYDSVGDPPVRVINDKETLAAREMQKQIKDKFSEWAWSEPDRATRLGQIYNEELNSDRLWQPDGSHLTFPGMNVGLKLRPHQKNGIWRIVRGDGNVLLAHVVGSGKTLEIVGGAMELRRLGKSKKPMVVVPNNRVGGTAEEWLRAYPSANILTIGGEDFKPELREQMMARIGTGNWDGVIVSGEAFTKVPVSDETFNSFLQQQIEEYRGFIREAEGDKSDTKIVKQLEKAVKGMEAKLRGKNENVRRDRAVSFEDLGVDSLFVDEADLYKNLQFPTKMSRISGIPNTESQRAFDMYMKTQYIANRNNGRGIIFATGTPVANSMAEVWTMQRYLQPQYLKEHGLQHFDSWAQTFGEVNPALEMTPDGSGVRVTNKFNKFVNMPELIKGFRQIADVQTAKMLQLPVPKLKGGRPTIVSAKASPAQQAYLKTLAERAKKVKGKKPQKGADNILVIGTDGQKAAVDIRLVDPSQPDHPTSKVNMAVDRIADTWKKTEAKKSTQIIFLDMSTPQPKGRAKGGFSVYEDMRDKLTRRGIPKNEIAFIQDYKGDEAKEELFARMNSGKVRVLFGSTVAAGVGVNVQKKLVAQHQLDAPYRPRDVEQREGRILRQGNENPEVEIVRYVTEPSFDARKWDILQGKAAYINAFMEGDMTVREMEDISDAELSYGEIAAIASGNPAIREKVVVDTEIRKLDAMRSRYEQQEYAIKRDLQALPGVIKSDRIEQKKAEKDLDTREVSANEFTIGKKTFKGDDARKDAGAALEKLLEARFAEKGTEFGSQTFPIGSYRGFRLVGIDYTSTDGVRREADILIHGELTYRSTNPNPATAIQSIEGKIRNIEGVRDAWAHSVAESEKKLADTKAIAGKSFDQADKLKTLLARQAELEKILQTKEPDASAVGGDEENPEAPVQKVPDEAQEQAREIAEKRAEGGERGSFSRANPYEKARRLEKAMAMAEVLDQAGATPEQLTGMTDEQWKMAADLGHVEPPHSDSTKNEVVKHLKLIQQVRSGEHGAIASDLMTLGIRSTPKSLRTVAAIPDLQRAGAKSNAVEALQSALEEESDKNFGEKLRTFVTGERDIRIAETNQLRDKLKKLIPNPVQQEALSLMRDFKNKEQELLDFFTGHHELFQDMDPDQRKEAYARMGKLAPAIEAALNPTPKMLEADDELTKYFTEHLAEGRKLGFLDSTISNEEYITHLLQPAELSQKPSLKDRIFRSGKLGPRKFKFAKGRFYPTVLHAVASGLGLRTLNALDALAIYGDKYATTAAYHLFLRAVRESAAGKWGTYSQQKAGEIPSDWTELAPESRIFRNEIPFLTPEGKPQVAHQNLFVPTKIEQAMQPIFDPNYMARVPGFQKGRMYQAYIKAVELGLSVFHLKALNLTALGNEGLSGLIGTYISDMDSPEFLDAEKSWVRAGLTTPILGRAVEAYQALKPSSLPTAAERIRSLPGLKQVDQAAAAITHLTFGIVQRKLKVTDASVKYARWIDNHPTATPGEAFEAQRLISKEINAAYGGLHWENLGVNRVTQELARALMLAPDWTFSNIFNVGQSFTGGPGGNAARMFWIRSIILGLALTAGLSIFLTGRRSKDPTRVLLGRDRKGKDLDDNVFFVGAPGDVSTLVHDVQKYGVIVGLARVIGNKLGPVARAGVHLMTNTDQMGRPIIPKKTNVNLLGQHTRTHTPGFLEKTGLGAEQLGRDVAPVPFSVSTLARMIMDKQHKYTMGQYAESIISGRQPTAVPVHAP